MMAALVVIMWAPDVPDAPPMSGLRRSPKMGKPSLAASTIISSALRRRPVRPRALNSAPERGRPVVKACARIPATVGWLIADSGLAEHYGRKVDQKGGLPKNPP